MTGVTFDTNDLQTAYIITASISHENLPTKDAPVYPLAHANKSVLPHINYPDKQITLTGKLVGDGISDLDSRIDTFKGYFNTKEANLDIDWAGGTRRYIATATSIMVDRPGGLAYANFSITFTCTEPFGKATSATAAISDTGNTTGSYNDSIVFAGNAPYQLPIITIDINSLTGGTGSYITVSNNATGQGVTVLADFVADDLIIINCEDRTVTINAVEVDYLGGFPEFEPGTQQLNYEDGFTARNIDYDVDYTPRYL